LETDMDKDKKLFIASRVGCGIVWLLYAIAVYKMLWGT